MLDVHIWSLKSHDGVLENENYEVWWSFSSKTSNVRFLPSGQLHMTSGNSSVNAVQLHARTRADAKAEVHIEQTPFTYPSITPSEVRITLIPVHISPKP